MSLPLNVITGFLGSGKTTLLKRLLADESLGDTALLINEFGDVGIDHLLVEEVAPGTVLLPSGCVCCSVRGELKEALLRLHEQRSRGEIPAFRRVLLETTGLADPGPIIATLNKDSQLRGRFHLGLLITVVDALQASLQERLHSEWLPQVAAADRLLISKADLADSDALAMLKARLSQLNPTAILAQVSDVHQGDALLLEDGLRSADPMSEVRRWRLFAPLAGGHQGAVQARPVVSARHGSVQMCNLEFDRPLDWVVFGVWLSLLLKCHGERILRVKGILDVINSPQPIVIHGVQHCLHAPVHLPAWPGEHRRSRLVFIVRDLDVKALERSFHAFLSSLGRVA